MIPAWNNLVAAVLKLPGVGPKMAERVSLHFVRNPGQAEAFMRALEEARTRIGRCGVCGDLVDKRDADPCRRCSDAGRDDVLCVVEDVGDLTAIERSGAYRGHYHVLGGALSALDGVGPDQLRIRELLERMRETRMREVILALNPTAEGETTAAYVADLLRASGVSVTRLAYGLPSGSSIQYADEFTLSQALAGRRALA